MRIFPLISGLLSNLFRGQVSRTFAPAPSFRGATPARKTKFGSSNAERRKALGLPTGLPGNKLAIRASKCKVSLSVIK